MSLQKGVSGLKGSRRQGFTVGFKREFGLFFTREDWGCGAEGPLQGPFKRAAFRPLDFGVWSSEV